jgi:condensin complex subunit 1
MSAVEEDFAQQFVRAGMHALEDAAACRSAEARAAAFDLVAIPARLYGQGVNVTVSLIHFLHNFEHAPAVIAELLEHMARGGAAGDGDGDDSAAGSAAGSAAADVSAANGGGDRAAGDVIREIGRMSPDDIARDAGGTRNVAAFLPELAQRLPRAVLSNIAVLLPHLGSESYTMRNGVVQAIGNVILGAFPEGRELSEAAARTRDSLLAVLEDRYRDVTSYTRGKTLQVWQALFEARAVPLTWLPRVTAIAVGRLEDKSAIVRKCAMQLLASLLRNNPFAAELRLSAFEAQLERCKLEMLQVVQRFESTKKANTPRKKKNKKRG